MLDGEVLDVEATSTQKRSATVAVKIAFYDETRPERNTDIERRIMDSLNALDGEVLDVEVTSTQLIRDIPDPDVSGRLPLTWAIGGWRNSARQAAPGSR